MLQGHPIAASLPEDLGLGERFWYWRGYSGRAYIHSIYASGLCPPVVGAVYVVVDVVNGGRKAVAVGRFPSGPFRLSPGLGTSNPALTGGREIHIHLLAREEEAAQAVLDDLASALWSMEQREVDHEGLREAPVQFDLVAA